MVVVGEACVTGEMSELAQVENELARIQVDSLNTIAHNEQLQTTLRGPG